MGEVSWDERCAQAAAKKRRFVASLNEHWAEEYFRLLAFMEADDERRRLRSASRGYSRQQLDARQAARMVRYREAHARLSQFYTGKALSREIRLALVDLYGGQDTRWRADREAFEKSAEVHS